ncbi:MAG TPA: hypothetical protein VLQ80_14305 [Candidatus Saccharimonadia bacterium]|nr:hypothetical protein [Candidatus Saccharimonadia bacterium]
MASEERETQVPETIAMPAPTVWPLVTALGITLGCAGLVTHMAVSAVGLVLFLRGLVGWWRDVLPVEKHEAVPVPPPEQRAAPVQTRLHTVAHLRLGERGHRVRIPAAIHPYSAGLKGGIVGGIAMAIVAVAYGIIAHGSPWYPINLLAAVALPMSAHISLEELKAFHALALIVALISHAAISLLVGLLYAAMLPMLPRHPAFWGGLMTPLMWTGLIWAFLDVINPMLNQHIDWRWFIASQVAFGMTGGFVIARSERIETMQTWPMAARAGLETPEVDPEQEQTP